LYKLYPVAGINISEAFSILVLIKEGMNKMRYSLTVTICLLLQLSFSGLQAQQKRLNESEKKTLITNFSIILEDVKNDFKAIATGELKGWQDKKASLSKVQLLPDYYKLDQIYSIYYGKDEATPGVQNNYFLDISPFSIMEMAAALSATLKEKGFIEVQPQRAEAIDTIRAFRSRDAVVELKGAKDMLEKKTSITIGKLLYYFGTNVLPVKPGKSTEKNKNYFAYEHPCGLKATGKYISGDTLIEGKIFYCTNNSKAPASFTGIYVNKGYLPRTYIGNASGNLPMNLVIRNGQLEFKHWGAVFTGEFVDNSPNSNIWAKGTLKVGADSLYGYLYRTTGYEPAYYLTPIDKNKKKVNLYTDYQNTGQAQVIYDKNTIAEEEQEWAAIEQRLKNRQNNTGNNPSGESQQTGSGSPESTRMVADATAARIKLYDWLRANDKAREADIIQCMKDRGYGAAVARMSGHCQRVEKYRKEINEKCYAYLKAYEKYTPSNHISDIKTRMKEAAGGSTPL